jgi:hypothetical protein
MIIRPSNDTPYGVHHSSAQGREDAALFHATKRMSATMRVLRSCRAFQKHTLGRLAGATVFIVVAVLKRCFREQSREYAGKAILSSRAIGGNRPKRSQNGVAQGST